MSGHEDSNSQEFLDKNQYSREAILRYEKIFGTNFVSTGGRHTTEDFCKRLNLKSGEKVLDVGCGIGGSAFYLAEEYDVEVHGVDISSNMIAIALERQSNQVLQNKVTFKVCDVTKEDYIGSFDVIYSRDAILHIASKEELFAKFYTWLKPGGRLLISDYCKGNQKHSKEFLEYVTQRCYHLLTVQEYGELLHKVGFMNSVAEDRTNQFIEILNTELQQFLHRKDEFLEEFSTEDFSYIQQGWENKIRRCIAGDQAWGLFYAVKN